ncbi:MAG: porin family protein [Muribaculaceae bacterium]|nr:porin family protein [Muribaculaceae bacterium]
MMKKVALSLILLFSALTMSAQLHYGLRLGGVFSAPNCSNTPQSTSIEGGSGFAGGLTANYMLPNTGFAIGASALYERRNISATAEGVKTKLGGDFIAVPIDLKYRLPVSIMSDLVSPYIFTGPNLAWRLNDAQGRRFHAGWNVGVSVDAISLLEISGGYRFGMNNINPQGFKLRDSGGFIAVAILFSI